LSKIAIDQLFAELGVKPKIATLGKLDHYSVQNLDIFVGDIFDLSRETLGPVDAIYDRAALVALPEKMRERYVTHLMDITGKMRQLLVCWEYDQSLMEGPPFSITDKDVKRYYEGNYKITLIESKDVPGGLKGKCAARESVWLLKNG
jgi:thiopurine S-methyltransferase